MNGFARLTPANRDHPDPRCFRQLCLTHQEVGPYMGETVFTRHPPYPCLSRVERIISHHYLSLIISYYHVERKS
jgi:hypothetical protein